MQRYSKRIVVVDDNEVIRMALRALLRQAGFNVVGEGRDGDMALDLAARLQPDLVCLDVMMPKRNGLEALDELRAKFPDIKVLMVTGQTDRDSVGEMVRKGAAGIVVKPFNAARIIELVERTLGLTATQ
ncbi:response regulator transcription factor [Azoarcus olearius]|uniref:Probable response regulator n=1 Tax=Azoarcus sp. (strain BH72) TaxID=418699 RepID=A1K770_AZOSB|nr:response regulator transcription factor [Azoarcus olearius]ANQ85221.1 response regulator [Azoarcus olearius]CAL94675.1 probable response regulator [Azoarcus olearius]